MTMTTATRARRSRALDQPISAVLQVTPELAAQMLEHNPRNRNLRARVVNAYARDMAAGNWVMSGESVKFDAAGNLLDGQHRLHAVIQSGATVPMMVVRGIDPAAQDVMDSGAQRKASDMFALEGWSNSATVASAARIAMAMRDGALSGERHRSSKYTHAELRDFVLENPDLAEAATVAQTFRNKGLGDIPPSITAVAWWTLSRIDAEDAHEFFSGMADNATSGRGDPRNALLHRVQGARRRGELLSQAAYISLVFRAWNAWRRGQRLEKMPTQTRGIATQIPKPR